MTYFAYHQNIKKKIFSGKFVKAKVVENYKNISPCLLLYFCDRANPYPVRSHKFREYGVILGLDKIENIENFMQYFV